ncbi:MAG: glycosyltransferase family 4 protein [Planctomycetia bacterium]|nr:glycosyltransferase family 4 protein [Planctomycetia bacterium]
MKIALVIERFEPWRGGAETSTQEIARLLAAMGHDVHVVTATNAVGPPDITIRRVPATTLLRPLRMAAFVRRTTELLRRERFDIIHAISPLAMADFYQPRGGLIGETLERNVATRSSRPRQLLKQALLAMNIKQRSLLDLERAVFQNPEVKILAVSKYVASQCERIYGALPPRVKVVFNGVRIPLPTPAEKAAHRSEIHRQHQIPDSSLVLLFVAHNFRLKGLGPLIETASRLVTSGYRDFRILVVGRDNPVGYQRRIESLGLSGHITFTGPSRRSQVYMDGADALVHPTYYDPCSRVVLEALSCGLPCLTTKFNGAAEVMSDGREGFVIDSPDDIGLWARRIRELADEDLRRKMSARALELREQLSMERHVKELDAIFRESVETRAPSRSA